MKNFDRNSCLVTATWFQLNLSLITIYCLVCWFWGEFEDKGHFSLINVMIPWYKSPFLSWKWLEIKVTLIVLLSGCQVEVMACLRMTYLTCFFFYKLSKAWFYRTLGWNFIFRMDGGYHKKEMWGTTLLLPPDGKMSQVWHIKTKVEKWQDCVKSQLSLFTTHNSRITQSLV